jgi:hypothetical protein
MQTININNYAINCYGNKLVFVNGSQSIIKTIISSINAGEFLNIRANGGSIAFENTDNIFFLSNNQNQAFILNDGGNATFVKVDNIIGNNYET